MSLSDEDKKWIRAQHQQMKADLLTELRKGPSPAELRQRTRAAVNRVLDLESELPYHRFRKPEGDSPIQQG